MCGRFGLVGNENELKRQFALKKIPDLFPDYNIAPSRSVLGIGRFEKDGREARHFQWGLIPSWAKDEKIGYRLINARGETVREKPSFRSAFARRRLIIPASYFFEWKREGAGKTPYLIRLKDHPLFGMAGLWERWTATTGEVIDSCTIITCEANEAVSELHDRMPVILPEEQLRPVARRRESGEPGCLLAPPAVFGGEDGAVSGHGESGEPADSIPRNAWNRPRSDLLSDALAAVKTVSTWRRVFP